MRMRILLLAFLILSLPPTTAAAQQKVDIHRASTPTVSVRLGGAVAAVRVVAWEHDSIAVVGVLGAGSKMDGGPFNVSGPVSGMKFFVDAADEAALRGNKLELRVPRNARVWIKAGSADIDVAGVAGGLDLNIVGGSVRVTGKPRELMVESMDGAVTVSGFVSYGRLKTATGDITVEGTGEDMTVSTVSGTIRVGDGRIERGRFESVTGPIIFSSDLVRGGDTRFDTHSGSIELRLARKASVEIDAATVTGSIENAWSFARPIAGREGRGMELGTSSGMGGARVSIRSFKGNVKISAK
jgi:putative adhesin